MSRRPDPGAYDALLTLLHKGNPVSTSEVRKALGWNQRATYKRLMSFWDRGWIEDVGARDNVRATRGPERVFRVTSSAPLRYDQEVHWKVHSSATNSEHVSTPVFHNLNRTWFTNQPRL